MKSFLGANRNYILIFSLFLAVTLINQLHFTYPDEFESILGGYYISHGRLPYTGFFTHHNPGTYFFAAPLAFFTGQSFVKFRLLLGVVYVGMIAAFYFWLKKRFGVFESRIFLVWSAVISVGATFWWGQMLLADTLSAYLLIVPVSILFWVSFRNEELRKVDLWLISIFSFLIIFTTFTLAFTALIICIWTLLWIIKKNSGKIRFSEIPKIFKPLLIIFTVPYLIFFLYLILTWSFQEYFYQSLIFNSKYYINLPDGASIKNPIRMAIVLFNQFFTNFRTALVMSKDLNFGNPFIQTLAVSNSVILLYLATKRRFFLFSFLLISLIFSMVRSNPYSTGESDYQGMAYQLLSIFNGILALSFIWKELQEKVLGQGIKLIYVVSFLFLGIYFFFFSYFLMDRAWDKAYLKYNGKESLIYDRPAIANVMNQLLNREDYYFIGPFDFEDHLYINSKLASKYIVVIPAMGGSDKIKEELLADLARTRPKLIAYASEYRVFGLMPGDFLAPFFNENYFTLEALGAPCKNYKAVTKWMDYYDFERHILIRRDLKDELIDAMLKKNFIAPVDPNNIPDFCKNRNI